MRLPSKYGTVLEVLKNAAEMPRDVKYKLLCRAKHLIGCSYLRDASTSSTIKSFLPLFPRPMRHLITSPAGNSIHEEQTQWITLHKLSPYLLAFPTGN